MTQTTPSDAKYDATSQIELKINLMRNQTRRRPDRATDGLGEGAGGRAGRGWRSQTNRPVTTTEGKGIDREGRTDGRMDRRGAVGRPFFATSGIRPRMTENFYRSV